jgi:hypothetical protein
MQLYVLKKKTNKINLKEWVLFLFIFILLSFDFLLLSQCTTEQCMAHHWWYAYHSLRNHAVEKATRNVANTHSLVVLFHSNFMLCGLFRYLQLLDGSSHTSPVLSDLLFHQLFNEKIISHGDYSTLNNTPVQAVRATGLFIKNWVFMVPTFRHNRGRLISSSV